MLCSANFSFDIPLRLIDEARWSEPSFLQTILCLRPTNTDIKDKMLALLNHPDPIMRGTALWFFYEPSKDLKTDLALVKVLRTDPDTVTRLSASLILRQVASGFPEVQIELVRALLEEKDVNVATNILEILNVTKLDAAAFELLKSGATRSAIPQKTAEFVVTHNQTK
jgi:hypothetical protein